MTKQISVAISAVLDAMKMKPSQASAALGQAGQG